MSFIVSICSIAFYQNNPSIQTEKQDDSILTEISAPTTSGYAVTQEWKWKSTFAGSPSQYQIEISKDGNYILGKWNNPNVTLFKKESNSTVWIFEGVSNILDIAISENGKYSVLSDNQYFYLLDNSAESIKNELWNYTSSEVVDNWFIDISLDGNLISAANGSHVFCFDKTGNLLWSYNTTHQICTGCVAISGNGNYIIAADTSGTFYLFNTTDYNGTPMWTHPVEPAYFVAISDNGQFVAVSCEDPDDNIYVYLFNTTNYKDTPMWIYSKINAALNDLAISSDGKYIVVAEAHNLLYFNNLPSSGPKEPLWINSTTGSSGFTSADINSDGSYIVGGTQTLTSVYLFNSSKTTPKTPEWESGGQVRDVAISGWGDYFAIANIKKEIILFHHARPIPPSPYLLPGDDDDDDDDDTVRAIPFENFYLAFAFAAIMALIAIMKKKALLK